MLQRMIPANQSAPSVESEAVIEDLWRELSAPLRNFLRSRTRSAADADDLLQDVFMRIHKQLPTLRDTSKLQGWVYRIARNALVDLHREKRETVPFMDDAADDDLGGQNLVDLTPSLRRFIAQLPPVYREPLVRHEFQGEALASVAASLGLTLTATKSRVRRARLLLREMLDRCCHFEFDRLGRVIAAVPRNTSACDCGHSKTINAVQCGN
ncbi:MAG: sigma-70 family RNA polymerase sigma factor [Nibricoccus sp.]